MNIGTCSLCDCPECVGGKGVGGRRGVSLPNRNRPLAHRYVSATAKATRRQPRRAERQAARRDLVVAVRDMYGGGW